VKEADDVLFSAQQDLVDAESAASSAQSRVDLWRKKLVDMEAEMSTLSPDRLSEIEALEREYSRLEDNISQAKAHLTEIQSFSTSTTTTSRKSKRPSIGRPSEQEMEHYFKHLESQLHPMKESLDQIDAQIKSYRAANKTQVVDPPEIKEAVFRFKYLTKDIKSIDSLIAYLQTYSFENVYSTLLLGSLQTKKNAMESKKSEGPSEDAEMYDRCAAHYLDWIRRELIFHKGVRNFEDAGGATDDLDISTEKKLKEAVTKLINAERAFLFKTATASSDDPAEEPNEELENALAAVTQAQDEKNAWVESHDNFRPRTKIEDLQTLISRLTESLDEKNRLLGLAQVSVDAFKEAYDTALQSAKEEDDANDQARDWGCIRHIPQEPATPAATSSMSTRASQSSHAPPQNGDDGFFFIEGVICHSVLENGTRCFRTKYEDYALDLNDPLMEEFEFAYSMYGVLDMAFRNKSADRNNTQTEVAPQGTKVARKTVAPVPVIGNSKVGIATESLPPLAVFEGLPVRTPYLNESSNCMVFSLFALIRHHPMETEIFKAVKDANISNGGGLNDFARACNIKNWPFALKKLRSGPLVGDTTGSRYKDWRLGQEGIFDWLIAQDSASFLVAGHGHCLGIDCSKRIIYDCSYKYAFQLSKEAIKQRGVTKITALREVVYQNHHYLKRKIGNATEDLVRPPPTPTKHAACSGSMETATVEGEAEGDGGPSDKMGQGESFVRETDFTDEQLSPCSCLNEAKPEPDAEPEIGTDSPQAAAPAEATTEDPLRLPTTPTKHAACSGSMETVPVEVEAEGDGGPSYEWDEEESFVDDFDFTDEQLSSLFSSDEAKPEPDAEPEIGTDSPQAAAPVEAAIGAPLRLALLATPDHPPSVVETLHPPLGPLLPDLLFTAVANGLGLKEAVYSRIRHRVRSEFDGSSVLDFFDRVLRKETPFGLRQLLPRDLPANPVHWLVQQTTGLFVLVSKARLRSDPGQCIALNCAAQGFFHPAHKFAIALCERNLTKLNISSFGLMAEVFVWKPSKSAPPSPPPGSIEYWTEHVAQGRIKDAKKRAVPHPSPTEEEGTLATKKTKTTR